MGVLKETRSVNCLWKRLFLVCACEVGVGVGVVLVLMKFESNSKNLLEGGVYDVLRIYILKL